MKKILLTTAGLMALLQTFSQRAQPDSNFQSRKLKIEEVNLISSYYSQNGNNAAVTGGLGSEKLTDLSNSIDIKLVRYDRKLRKNTFTVDVGIDHYTSASSDKIDLKANSSASYSDTRIYPSLGWTIENEQKGRTLSAGVSYSSEFDYQSVGANLSFAQKTKNRMGEFTAKFQAYLDQVSLIAPTELRQNGSNEVDNGGSAARNTFAATLSYSQIVNERLQLIVLADFVSQQGYLSLPFHRVYFSDGTVHQEKLPDTRFKFPIGIRASYFLGDRFILRGYYRYYMDSWGVQSHTANIEVPIKLSPFFSVSPYYRYYQQTAVDAFAAYGQHNTTEKYYTSNYDLSGFKSHFVGGGIHLTPEKGVFGWKRLNTLELRYGHYIRSTSLNSNIVSVNLKFK